MFWVGTKPKTTDRNVYFYIKTLHILKGSGCNGLVFLIIEILMEKHALQNG